jgi:uncharacterized protein (DUF1501 family)
MTVFSDVVCPWCYVGRRRLARAVEMLDGKHEIRVTWKPFQLNPWIPQEGMDRAEYRLKKFGSAERSSGMDTRLKEAGQGEGIELAFERIAAADYNDVYARAYADVQRRAVLYAKQVNDTLEAAPALATGFNAQSALATQLKTVAKMIAVRDRLDMSRQIFFVATGGYDTHDDQLANQPGLLSDLSESLSAFYAATVELGVSQNVTTFTQSDFGRSLTSNGDGSDHAWGGVQLVVGDSVSGGTIYGQYPLLQIGSPLDVGGGRLIPSLSTHQYAATLSQWFGVPPDQLDAIAPDLLNFSPTNLGFLNA